MIDEKDAPALISGLQHNPRETMLLGCQSCVDRNMCGGLRVRASMIDCLDHCRPCTPHACDQVCPRNNKFARDVREVQGFDLMSLKRHEPIRHPNLPNHIHMMYRAPRLNGLIWQQYAAIPLSEVYRQQGKDADVLSLADVYAKFKLAPGTRLLLCGIEDDRKVEKWWRHSKNQDLLRGIAKLGAAMATTPNFSVIADVPRHDNMHSMKRIVLAWEELHGAGIPTALHVNGRTDHDFTRIAHFVREHEEIEAVSFEFETGTAKKDRGEYFVGELVRFAQYVERPLTLITRAGAIWLPQLAPSFRQVVLISSDAAMRTRKRQRAHLADDRLRWESHRTNPNESLDQLYSHNIEVVSAYLSELRSKIRPARPQKSRTPVSAPSQVKRDTHYEPVQLSLLNHAGLS